MVGAHKQHTGVFSTAGKQTLLKCIHIRLYITAQQLTAPWHIPAPMFILLYILSAHSFVFVITFYYPSLDMFLSCKCTYSHSLRSSNYSIHSLLISNIGHMDFINELQRTYFPCGSMKFVLVLGHGKRFLWIIFVEH